MKHMRKVFSLLLVLVIVMGLVTTVSADEANLFNITITNSVTGHTYEAYQIFKGDLSNNASNDASDGTNAVLSHIDWGKNVTTTDGRNALLGFIGGTCDSPAKLAEALTEDNIVAFSRVAATAIDGTPAGKATAPVDSRYVISDLEPGYYLVMDRTTLSGHDAYTAYILEVVENSTLSPKSSVPQTNKFVLDDNDSIPNQGENKEILEWDTSADYDIGDNVPFMITTVLANNLESFAGPYKLVYQDTMQESLTYNHDMEIYIGKPGETATLIYDETKTTDNPTGITVTYSGTSLTITIDDAKEIGAKNGDILTIQYSATLNKDAIHYIDGNTNSVRLVYANNPNWTKPGTDHTPDDPNNPNEDPKDPPTGTTPDSTVVVFTYELGVDKVRPNPAYDPEKDPDGDQIDSADHPMYLPLAGADFTLYKWVQTTDTDGAWVAVNVDRKTISDDGTGFSWNGLDDGKYKLVETTTPPGYNTAEDLEFEITADHTLDGTNKKLTLEGDGFTLVDGVLTANVVNKPGTVLPETGGMGTTILYIAGGILVLAAVVLLVTKKRMSSAE